jgi:hypothetical protein
MGYLRIVQLNDEFDRAHRLMAAPYRACARSRSRLRRAIYTAGFKFNHFPWEFY